ncbi:MAG: TolC family protein [Planctomycetota bacterium]|nr:TolC family protein [Planctomycetota bacterium]
MFATLLLAGCQSPDSLVADADEEAYQILDERRAELFGDQGKFRLEPEKATLRQRILGGETLGETPVGLVELLGIASENSRTYQTERESLYLAALDLSLERWRMSWLVSAGGASDLSGTGNSNTSASASADLGLTHVLGSGARIVTSIGTSLLRFVSTGDGWTLSNDLSLTITQPLLRGAGRRVTLEPLTQAERSMVYQARSFERFRREYSVDVAGRLYSLLQTMDELDNQRRNYKNLVSLRQRNEAMAAAGRLSRIEADQAMQDELRSENQLIAQEALLESRTDNLMLFLGLPITASLPLDRSEFERLSGDDKLIISLDLDRAVDLALAQRLDFLTSLDQLEDTLRRELLAEDATRAGLDLQASLLAPSATDQALKYDWRTTGWSLGFSFDLPWDQIPERNALRSAQISVDARRRAVEAEADGIVVEVRNAVRQTRNAYQTWNLQAGAVVLAERRVESSDLNLENGKASTRDVLDAEEDLRQALNSRSAALVDYSLSRLGLYLDVEALRVDEDGIGLDPESLVKLGAGQEADVEVVEQPEGGSDPVLDDSEAPAEQAFR